MVIPPSGRTCIQGKSGLLSVPLTAIEAPQLSPLVHAVSEIWKVLLSEFLCVTTVYTSPAPIPLVRGSTAMCGLSGKAFNPEMLVTATVVKQGAVPNSVPLGQAELLFRLAEVV